jgi:hypothetical protein
VIYKLNLNILKTLITSFIALPLFYKVGINISLFNNFFFFLLSTCKGACLKEKYLRALVLSLRAYFNKELLFRDSLAYRLD